jgi:hypothetical protein
MIHAGGTFIPIENHASVDSDAIAKRMARDVFSQKYKMVIMGKPDGVDMGPYLLLEISAEASTNAMNGDHLALVEGVFSNSEGETLFRASTAHKVDDWQYGQSDSIERAFYGAYQKLLEQFEGYLGSASHQ